MILLVSGTLIYREIRLTFTNLTPESTALCVIIPDELGQCGALEVLYLSQNQLTGGVPASLGKCAKLMKLKLEANRLEGAVPATELAALTALTLLALSPKNEGLTITASGAQALKQALPNAKLFLPTEVAG